MPMAWQACQPVVGGAGVGAALGGDGVVVASGGVVAAAAATGTGVGAGPPRHLAKQSAIVVYRKS